MLFERLSQLSHRLQSIPAVTALFRLTSRINPHPGQDWLQVTSLSLALPRLSPAFEGYRIAQISDFHIGTWLNRARLEHAIERVNLLRPDLVAITGDFVTLRPEYYAADLVSALQQISAPDGVMAVLGNHDHWSNPSQVRQILHAAGVTELDNRFITIRRMDESLHIAGVDDIACEQDDLDRVLADLPETGAAILLAHEPDFADVSSQSRRFDLQLSGHTHGGQIVIKPFRPWLLPRLGKKYLSGLYQVEGMYVYTNRGLGTASEIQVRLNCPAEITLLELRANV